MANPPGSPDPRATLRSWLVTGQPPQSADVHTSAQLVETARTQGLVGLLASAVRSGSAPWPASVVSRLEGLQRSRFVCGVRQLETAARLLERLEARGVRALPIKGAAVAEFLYESVADRPMADVDLLVLDDWPAAAAILDAHGFRVLERADHAWSFSDGDTGTVVELHRGLATCPALFPFDADALWRRGRPGTGRVPKLPAPEDLLVQLAVHAVFQHGGTLSLAQWLDFRRLCEQAALEPGTLADASRARPIRRALALALALAEALVAAPIPAPIRALFSADESARVRRWLAARGPLAFVTPSRPALLRARWAVARGHRLPLVWWSLFPSTADAGFASRLAHASSRVGRVASALAREIGDAVRPA